MEKAKPESIFVIVCDQLAYRAVGACGQKHVKTPNMDRILNGGTCFRQSYTPYPLCMPARACYWTGQLPHKTGVISNGIQGEAQAIPSDMPTLGSLAQEQGYRPFHFGKTHDAGSLKGFEVIPVEEDEVIGSKARPTHYDSRRDAATLRQCLGFLEQPPSEPILMAIDLFNPHDICSWVGAFKEDSPLDHEGIDLPPLPFNFGMENILTLPKSVQYISCAHRRQSQTQGWTDEKYRAYLDAYLHYVEVVDAQIGMILDAIEKHFDLEDILIAFMADHGDMMGAHGLVTKHTSFYEEASHVPFALWGMGWTGGQDVDLPTSTSDLMPTLVEAMGGEVPEGLYGESLFKHRDGRKVRNSAMSHWYSEWGTTIEPGRMLVCDGMKYTYYVEDGGEELYDLEKDPGEMHNAASDPAYASSLEAMRLRFRREVERTGDDIFSLKAEVSRRPGHPPGQHKGPSVPELMGRC